jgi:hypothetical protein
LVALAFLLGTATVQAETGLQVFMQPPLACADGAQWRRIGTTTYNDSGFVETGLTPGSAVVEFKPIAGWVAPANEDVQILTGQRALTTGTYTAVPLLTGLRVFIEPTSATLAGAQWRVVSATTTTLFLNSGVTETGLTSGPAVVEFSAVTGWVPPANQNVAILTNQTAVTTGTYTPPVGPVAVPPSGSGTQADPYQITELGNLLWMSNNVATQGVAGKYYKLMTDIDASATAYWSGGFAPIGAWSDPDYTFFGGVFDGNGKTITGLTINRPTKDYVGLFGYIDSGGSVTNLTLSGGTVMGGGYVADLVGWSESGTVTNCRATGAVSGTSDVGGLVGVANTSSTITNCYATGAVTGNNYVGGLAGESWGTITHCYATGTVSGTSDVGGLVGSSGFGTITNSHATGGVSSTGTGGTVGGLVGYSDGGSIANCYATGGVSSTSYSVGGLVEYNDKTITNCYATGAVSGTAQVGGLVGYDDYTITDSYSTGAVSGTGQVGGLVGFLDSGAVTNSYWDTQTSGRPTSAGGTGKTTTQMKRQATFVGWDFTNTWGIVESATYPFLKAIIPPGWESTLIVY